MAASIADQLQHLELAPVAPPSHYESNPSGEAKTTPALPPELIADIIELTVELLVEEERHLASQIPLTNHFLLSASLVDRTWHSIASTALLKNGLVTPNRAYRFLAEIERGKIAGTLDRVRFGAGPGGLDRSPLAEGEISDDRIFQALISSLPAIKTIEFVGIGLRFSGDCWLVGFRAPELVLSNTNADEIFMVITKLASSPLPLRLSIVETRAQNRGDVRYWVSDPVAFKYLARIPHLLFRTNQLPKSIYLFLVARIGAAHAEAGTTPCLRSFRLDATLERPWDTTELEVFQNHLNKSHFPHLVTLSTHLDPLHLLATNGNRASLTYLEVLPDRPLEGGTTSTEIAETKLIEVLKKLPVLKTLQVPACWRSEAVEEACEAKGIELRWT